MSRMATNGNLEGGERREEGFEIGARRRLCAGRDGGGGWWIHLSHQFARRFLERGEVDLKLSNGFQLAAEIAY